MKVERHETGNSQAYDNTSTHNTPEKITDVPTGYVDDSSFVARVSLAHALMKSVTDFARGALP